MIAREILRALLARAKSCEFFVVYSKGYGYEDILRRDSCRTYCYQDTHGPARRWFFEQAALPKIVRQAAPDVLMGLGNISIPHPPCPQVLLIHNAYLYSDSRSAPGLSLLERLRFRSLRRQVASCLPATDRVFVQTPVVRQRFSEWYGYPPERISVLRMPVPVEIRPQPDCPEPDLLKNRRGWFCVLMLTRHMPHRNPDILLPLCRRHHEQLRREKICFVTTVSADARKQAHLFLQQVRQEGFEDLIVNAGPLNRSQVVQYYTHCHLLWLHTRMETLCLPFLEAMTMGVPILAPDYDFARYVCSDAAQYYSPDSLESVFENLLRLRQDEAIRRRLTDSGRRQLTDRSKFAENWEQVAEELLEHFSNLARGQYSKGDSA